MVRQSIKLILQFTKAQQFNQQFKHKVLIMIKFKFYLQQLCDTAYRYGLSKQYTISRFPQIQPCDLPIKAVPNHVKISLTYLIDHAVEREYFQLPVQYTESLCLAQNMTL